MSKRDLILHFFENRWPVFYEHFVELPSHCKDKVKVHSPLRTDDTDPSFQICFVGEFAGHWYDFGTGERGDAFTFYQRLRSVPSFPDTLDLIIQEFAIPVLKRAVKDRIPKQIKSLKERGISKETAQMFQLEEAKGNDSVSHIIQFPVFDRSSKKIGMKTHKAGQTKGNVAQLYPWTSLENEVLYLVNGEPSVWRAWESGHRNIICGTGGEGVFKEEWVWLFADKKVRLTLDNDNVGCKAMEKIGRMLESIALSVEVVQWPEQFRNKGDLEDWLQSGGDIDSLNYTPLLNDDTLVDGRPIIRADDGELIPVLEAARNALSLIRNSSEIYRQGGRIVRLEKTEVGEISLEAVSPDGLLEHLAISAKWVRTKKEGQCPTKPPRDIARVILDGDKSFLRPLSRIIRSPIMAPSGKIISSPGYNSETRTFYAPDKLSLPNIPERPTDTDVRDAAGLIQNELLGDFPFVEDADVANALGMFLLPFARELIDGPTPLHLIEKPSPGSGASLMVEVVGMVARGCAPVMMSEGNGEDEWRKRITSTLTYAPEMVVIDNIRRRLDSSALSSALTLRVWTDRKLGATENISVPVRCVWVATGNNPAVSNEISRRTVPIRIDTRIDRPWERDNEKFKHPNLMNWALEKRGELIASALTLLRAWIIAGRPGCQANLGSYEAWARVIGGVLEVIGISGFLDNRTRFYDRADSETDAWRAFVGAWFDKYGETNVGVSDLWSLVDHSNGDDAEPIEPPADLGQGTDRSQRSRLGKALAQQVDRMFGVDGQALTVVSAPKKQRAAQFRIQLAEE
jgi:hypothetical protein